MGESQTKPFQVQVDCYAGHKADETPTRFRFGERTYQIEEVIDRWYEPDQTYFKVRADDGHDYILRQDESGTWTMESFRAKT